MSKGATGKEEFFPVYYRNGDTSCAWWKKSYHVLGWSGGTNMVQSNLKPKPWWMAGLHLDYTPCLEATLHEGHHLPAHLPFDIAHCARLRHSSFMGYAPTLQGVSCRLGKIGEWRTLSACIHTARHVAILSCRETMYSLSFLPLHSLNFRTRTSISLVSSDKAEQHFTLACRHGHFIWLPASIF
jgi:hypothetical protein